LQVTVAKLAVVGAVAPAQSGSLDSDLEFIGGRVGDCTSFLFEAVSIVLETQITPHPPPRTVGRCGMFTEEEGIRAASPLAHARRKLPQSTTWSSALRGLDRCRRGRREPLRERFESMGDGGSGTGGGE